MKGTQDVFLAYSSKARATANDIQKFLSDRGASVLDWEIHFAPGSAILDELLQASRTCLGAIMLLTFWERVVSGWSSRAASREECRIEPSKRLVFSSDGG